MTDGMDRRLRWPCTAPRAGDTFGVFGSQRTKVSDVGSPPLEGVPAPVRVLFPMERMPATRLGVSSSGRHARAVFGSLPMEGTSRRGMVRFLLCATATALRTPRLEPYSKAHVLPNNPCSVLSALLHIRRVVQPHELPRRRCLRLELCARPRAQCRLVRQPCQKVDQLTYFGRDSHCATRYAYNQVQNLTWHDP